MVFGSVLILIGIDALYYIYFVKPVAKIINQPPPPLTSVLDHVDRSIAQTAHVSSVHPITPVPANQIGEQLPGYQYAVLIPFNKSLSRAYGTDNSSVVATIEHIFSQSGFIIASSNQMSQGLLGIQIFHRGDAVCQVVTASSLTINCDSIQDLRSIATAVQPFIASSPELTESAAALSVGRPTITSSQTSGYTIALLPVYDGSIETDVHYYLSPGGSWQAINTTWYNDPTQSGNIMPNCEDFESVSAIQAAYKGQTCFDSSTRSIRTIL